MVGKKKDDDKNQYNTNWGGVRTPGPGKRIGRPKKTRGAKTKNVGGIRCSEQEYLLVRNAVRILNVSESDFVRQAFVEKANQVIELHDKITNTG